MLVFKGFAKLGRIFLVQGADLKRRPTHLWDPPPLVRTENHMESHMDYSLNSLQGIL